MEPRDFRTAMEAADRAAASGDFVSTERLLTVAARLQEQELGPWHPELAVTVNNLAIVCERIGKLDDAEAHYRRAAEIAAAALPPDDPAVETSRHNLEDFIRARQAQQAARAEPAVRLGLAGDVVPDAPATAPSTSGPAASKTGTTALAPGGERAAAGPPRLSIAEEAAAAAASSTRPEPDPDRFVSEPSHPSARPAAASPGSRWPVLVAVGVLVVVALLFVLRSWSGSASSESPVPMSEQPADTATPGDSDERSADNAVPGTEGAAESSPAPPRTNDSGTPEENAAGAAAASKPAEGDPTGTEAAAGSTGSEGRTAGEASGVSLVQADVCRSFAPRGSRWRCDPVGADTEPGQLAYYTRVKSPRRTKIEHRWYQDDKLLRTVTLTIGANPGAGYRTYSRQTVRGDASTWRVETRAADGTLLHEHRFVVK
ncbi:MAG TPA: DUF2914 domain-containing protein [Vicinamibacterales bacterium]